MTYPTSSHHVAVAETVGFQQDRFAIGMWVDPPVDARVDDHYEELATAGFSFVIANFGANTPEKQQQVLDLCEENNLKALVGTLGRAPEDLPTHPACWGYCLKDEPSTSEFQELAETVDKVRTARPGRLAYINLFPGYASPWGTLGAESYDAYVRQFVDTVNPDVLSMDHYPRFHPDGDGRDNYCSDLAVIRKFALQQGIPFWNFFNTMPYGPHTDPTEDQLRWQIFTSLAFGAKGIMYFCYWTPTGGEFPKGGAIIRADGQQTRHYEQAQRLNAVVNNLGATLMELTSKSVVRISPGSDPEQLLSGTPLVNLRHAETDPPLDYLVGVMDHRDGRQAVLLQNYRYQFTAWPTVDFSVPADRVVEVCQHTGKEIPLVDDSPAMAGTQISLDAGQGRLFLFPTD